MGHMKMRRILFFAVSTMAVAWTFGAEHAEAGQIKSRRQAELTNLVRQDCGSCHGMTLKGGLGRSLLPQDLQDKTVQDIANTILDGVPGTPMPPWRGLLTQQDADWIATALKFGRIRKGNQP